MAGRGRGATLPAWMQQQGQGGGSAMSEPAAPGAQMKPPAPGFQHPTMLLGSDKDRQIVVPPSGRGVGAQAALRPVQTMDGSSTWTVHTAPDGRTYYYNRALGKSSWEKPAEMMSQEDKNIYYSNLERNDTGASLTSAVAASSSEWGEFTAPDGKKYYYNRVTKESRWTLPAGVVVATRSATETPTLVANKDMQRPPSVSAPIRPTSIPQGASIGAVVPPPTMRPLLRPPVNMTLTGSMGVPAIVRPPALTKIQEINLQPKAQVSQAQKQERDTKDRHVIPPGVIQPGVLQCSTQKEAKEAFMSLLREAKIPSKMVWETCSRLIQEDRRYGALKKPGDRKAAFNEYVRQRKKEEAEEARQRRVQARENLYEEFSKCFGHWLTGPLPTYSDVKERCGPQPTWSAVETEREREDIYEDWLAEYARRIAESREKESLKRKDALLSSLKSIPDISPGTTWDSIEERLHEKSAYQNANELERLQAWEEILAEMDKEIITNRRKKLNDIKRNDRTARDNFKSFLEEQVAAGKIAPKSRWREYRETIVNEPRLLDVEGTSSGSRPKELFMDVVERLEEDFKVHRKYLKSVKDLLGEKFPKIIQHDFSSILEFEKGPRNELEEAEGASRSSLAYALGLEREPPELVFRHFDEWKADLKHQIEEHCDEEMKSRVKEIPDSSVRMYYAELRDRQRQKNLESYNNFISLLDRRVRSSAKRASFEDAEDDCSDSKSWSKVSGGEDARKLLFDLWKESEMRRETEKSNRKKDVREKLQALQEPDKENEARNRDKYESERQIRERSRSTSRMNAKRRQRHRDHSVSSNRSRDDSDRHGEKRYYDSQGHSSRSKRRKHDHRSHHEQSREDRKSKQKRQDDKDGSDFSMEEGEVS